MNIKEVQASIVVILRRVCIGIILHPDELVITPTPATNALAIRMRAHLSDTGKLIGERGVMFRALRTVVQVIGASHGVTVDMERMEEPKPGVPDPFTKFVPIEQETDYSDLNDILRDIMGLVLKHGGADIVWDKKGVEVRVTISVSARESMRTLDPLTEALRTIVTAIGRTRGQIIYLTIQNDITEQPETPKGRYA